MDKTALNLERAELHRRSTKFHILM